MARQIGNSNRVAAAPVGVFVNRAGKVLRLCDAQNIVQLNGYQRHIRPREGLVNGACEIRGPRRGERPDQRDVARPLGPQPHANAASIQPSFCHQSMSWPVW